MVCGVGLIALPPFSLRGEGGGVERGVFVGEKRHAFLCFVGLWGWFYSDGGDWVAAGCVQQVVGRGEGGRDCLTHGDGWGGLMIHYWD